MKIAYIVVTYYTPQVELEALKNQIKKINKNSTIVVVDNTATSEGYAMGVNRGIRLAGETFDLYVVMNPDIDLSGLTKADLLSGSEVFDIWGGAIKQGQIVYYKGIIDPKRLSGGLSSDKPLERYTRSDFVSGSFMLIKKKVIETIGYFDERYGMYYEDVDYCLRARNSGLRVGVDTGWSYVHHEVSKKSTEKNSQLAQSRLMFFRKYATWPLKIRELVRLPKTLWEERGNSAFLTNFVSLNVSSVLNKGLNFILFLVLIQFLQPSEYGIYILVWAQVGLLGPLIDFGTTSYGLIHGHEKESVTLSKLFSFRIVLSIIAFTITILVSSVLYGHQHILGYVLLTSMLFFFNMSSGSYLILSSIRQDLYKASSLSVMLNTIMIILLSMVTYFTRNLTLLFISISLTYGLYTIYYLLLIKKRLPTFHIEIDVESWKEIVKKSSVFVLISFFAGIYFKADVFLLNYFKTAGDIGTYSAGYKFLEALVFIAASYNIAATPIFAKLAGGKRQVFLSRIKRDMVVLSLIGTIIAVGFLVAGQYVLPLFLKGEYHDSVRVATIVMWALPFILISSVFINVLYVLKRTHIVAVIFFIEVLINVILNTIYIPKYSYMASSYITVLSEILNAGFFLVAAYITIRRNKFETNTVL